MLVKIKYASYQWIMERIEHNRQEEYEYVRNNYDWSIIAKKFYDNMENIYNEFYHNQNGNDNLKD